MIDNTHTLDILHFIQLLKFVTLSQNGYNNGRTNIIMASDTICVACGHLRATHITGIGDLDKGCFMPKCKCRKFKE